MSGFEDRLKAGWAEEQQLLRRIKADQKRLREVRKDRTKLLIDLCTDRPLLDRMSEDDPPAPPSLPVTNPSRAEIASAISGTLTEVGDDDLATTLAHLLSKIEDVKLREQYHQWVVTADRPELWPDKLRTVATRQHLVEDDDWTSEYARQYLDEVSQRANDLFAAITEWRRLDRDYSDPVIRWSQWFECEIEINDGPDKLGDLIEILYRYGDLTSKADGMKLVECDFRFSVRGSGVVSITRVIGPASRSVGGESIRDQLRVIAQAVYEDACREAREMARPTTAAKPKKAKKGGGQ